MLLVLYEAKVHYTLNCQA